MLNQSEHPQKRGGTLPPVLTRGYPDGTPERLPESFCVQIAAALRDNRDWFLRVEQQTAGGSHPLPAQGFGKPLPRLPPEHPRKRLRPHGKAARICRERMRGRHVAPDFLENPRHFDSRPFRHLQADQTDGLQRYFGLDPLRQIWLGVRAPETPQPASHGAGIAQDEADYERLLPFLFGDAAIEGVLPLERQAGVDVNRIRKNDPDWILIGGYDKTIMHLGEEAMRREFDRLLPAMQSGRYIPSVDHQTPPDVSLSQYRTYVSLLREYAARCGQGGAQ